MKKIESDGNEKKIAKMMTLVSDAMDDVFAADFTGTADIRVSVVDGELTQASCRPNLAN